MRLAEALNRRADLNARLGELRKRVLANARYQEGGAPAEDPEELLAEFGRLADELEALIRRINATNLATPFGDGRTLTDALARRDVLRIRQQLHSALADGASQLQPRMRAAEIRTVPSVDVAAVRRAADELAREFRRLDTRIQELNWTTELVG
ncbi:DIP1984 family protein [Allonocardiopsis opalescens]|uniref:Septicolysin n=1 Tax=Allonocardiopsis opalescens TaxID=1144618 RepID=A0A2T0Q7Y7_9ACTN|nr:DIP1984 family protein [Allonocardiopsis opalescens]PRX99934.1 hypothetical protein CLV72_103541 [Allonocardiopsis opalescens]